MKVKGYYNSINYIHYKGISTNSTHYSVEIKHMSNSIVHSFNPSDIVSATLCPQKGNLPAFLRHHTRLHLLINPVALNIDRTDYILPSDRAKCVLRSIIIPFPIREWIIRQMGRRRQIWLEECVEYGGCVRYWDVLVVVYSGNA